MCGAEGGKNGGRLGLVIPVLQVQFSLCMGEWRFGSTH
jgi:hypothetical protein